MRNFVYLRISLVFLLLTALIFVVSCQQPTNNSNTVTVNSNANLSSNSNTNLAANTNLSNTNSTAVIETKEPDQYQSKITLRFEAVGNQQKTTLPNITANIARNGQDRRMEFNLPNGEKAVYLDKAETNYLILPNRKQYAVLDRESLGFDIRQMMMPAEIINQIKTARGVEQVGVENFNGRDVIRYRYGATTNTQTQAGQVNTDSYFLVDKATGLPLYSETFSQSNTGNVQGYNGLRIITEMSDISTATTPEQFAAPTDFQKIDAEQVKAQVNLVFNAVALLLNQAMKSLQPNSNSNSAMNTNSATPTTSPTAR